MVCLVSGQQVRDAAVQTKPRVLRGGFFACLLMGAALGVACGDDGVASDPSPSVDDAHSDGASPDESEQRGDAGPFDAGALPSDEEAVEEAGTHADAGPGEDMDTERDGGGQHTIEDAGPAAAEDSVPMFVAVGWGGRRLMSCDLGRTWIADQQEANESEDNWHRSYTPKGLAYGEGRFIFLTGWGTSSVAHVSTNGIDWTSKPLDTSYGGIGYDAGRFVLVGNRHLSASEDGGASFKVLTSVPTPSADRDTAAFDGIWAAGADGSASFLTAGSDKWKAMSSCSGSRHTSIGLNGGFAAGLGVLVSVGDQGNTCAVDLASGADRGAGTLGRQVSGRIAFVGDAFWLANGDGIHTSVDGVSWSRRALPAGVRFEQVARSSSGTYVGVSADGDHFFYSDDGQTWKAGKGPSGNGLVRVVFGYGAPSAKCPAP